LTIDGDGKERPFYDDDDEEHNNGDVEKDDEDEGSSSSSNEEDNEDDGQKKKKIGTKTKGKRKSSKQQKASMDPDHRLLLKNARPLLQSRNSAVRIQFLFNIIYLFSHLTMLNTL
jgi:hypothetical protein